MEFEIKNVDFEPVGFGNPFPKINIEIKTKKFEFTISYFKRENIWFYAGIWGTNEFHNHASREKEFFLKAGSKEMLLHHEKVRLFTLMG